ncbi:MAG: hypothetical protein QNJ53_27770 [Pleurocapsa sp. MO_192.B19]|nr:hypothetical protein [Pleurocapsa sp. MO_192.B19]
MLRLEFWLPLPLLGLAFWFFSSIVTEHSLNQGDRSIESFNITPEQSEAANNILLIKVTLDRDRNISQVKVKQITQVYQQQEFELATTELERVETAISQKLNLPPEKVRQLLRYQIKKP